LATHFQHAIPMIQAAEALARDGATASAVLPVLRQLSLDDFGLLLLQMPAKDYPALSSILPRMTPEDIQQKWTGQSGRPLLNSGVEFVRLLRGNYQSLTGKDFSDRMVLDFGCGYGRLIRLMYYYTDPDKIFGVDAWQVSLQFCYDAGLLGNILKSEVIPETLPLNGQQFDLVYSFSVFTHLSIPPTLAAFASIRQHTAAGGLFIFTIRPVEYWEQLGQQEGGRDYSAAILEHRKDGIAFLPTSRDGSFDTTSMSFDFLRNVPGWRMIRYDFNAMQLAITFRPQ
jgi:SAM-dependent methyltransferase